MYRGPRLRRDFVDALASPQPAISFLEFDIWCLEIKNPRLIGDFKSLNRNSVLAIFIKALRDMYIFGL